MRHGPLGIATIRRVGRRILVQNVNDSDRCGLLVNFIRNSDHLRNKLCRSLIIFVNGINRQIGFRKPYRRGGARRELPNISRSGETKRRA